MSRISKRNPDRTKGTGSFILLVALTLVMIALGLLIEFHGRIQRRHRLNVLRSQTDQMVLLGKDLADDAEKTEWDVTPEGSKQRWTITRSTESENGRIQARITSGDKTLALDEERLP